MDLFKSLVGKKVKFYGVDNNEFKIDDTVFEAFEDPDDGWRSYLGSIEVVNSEGIFFKEPLAEVIIEESEYCSGFILKDTLDDHIWLEVGTDYSEDWYPCFVFYYEPKAI